MIIENFLTDDELKDLEKGIAAIGAKYGDAHQWLKLCEECGEFISARAITGQLIEQGKKEKALQSVRDEFEEAADVFTVLLTIISTFDTFDGKLFMSIVRAKVIRQLTRIKEEEEEAKVTSDGAA